MATRTCDVVIATRDRPVALRRCLDGLRRQSTNGFGVIVVDDGSEVPVPPGIGDEVGIDATVLTRLTSGGPAAARNAGVAHSRAEHVVFIDDDVVASHYAIERHIAAVTAPAGDAPPVVSCGPFVQPGDWHPPPWNRWEARQAKKEADHLISGAWPVTWRQFHTGNNCLPRRVFEAVGGFDESYGRAEDDELGLRLARHGCRFRFEPAAIAWHYAHRSLEAWLAIPRAYAHYDVVMDRQYPEERWLAHKEAEHSTRRWPLRAARAVCGIGWRGRLGARGSVAAGRLLARVGLDEWSMAAMSVAYDVSYTAALRAELAPQGGSRAC